MRKRLRLLFVLEQSYICYYITCITTRLHTLFWVINLTQNFVLVSYWVKNTNILAPTTEKKIVVTAFNNQIIKLYTSCDRV